MSNSNESKLETADEKAADEKRQAAAENFKPADDGLNGPESTDGKDETVQTETEQAETEQIAAEDANAGSIELADASQAENDNPSDSNADPSNAEASVVQDAESGEGSTSQDTAGEESTRPRGKIALRKRPPYLMIASLTALTVLAANGAWRLLAPAPEVVAPVVEPKELLSEMVLAVKNGETDTIELSQALVTDEEVESIRDLENLRILILDAGMITDAGMQVVGTLPNLIHLRIRQSLITDAGIQPILGLKKLRILNLPQANLSLDGMRSLNQLDSLRQLRIGGDGTTDLSRAVSEMTQLRALHLIDIPVSDEGIRSIAKLPRLESLYLDNARVTEVGWQWLFDNHPEIHVHLNQRHHDRDPNWHLHDPEREMDDMESQATIDDDPAEILKRHQEAKAAAEAEAETKAAADAQSGTGK